MKTPRFETPTVPPERRDRSREPFRPTRCPLRTDHPRLGVSVLSRTKYRRLTHTSHADQLRCSSRETAHPPTERRAHGVRRIRILRRRRTVATHHRTSWSGCNPRRCRARRNIHSNRSINFGLRRRSYHYEAFGERCEMQTTLASLLKRRGSRTHNQLCMLSDRFFQAQHALAYAARNGKGSSLHALPSPAFMQNCAQVVGTRRSATL